MFSISNFRTGLIPSAAFTPSRNYAAVDAANVRHDSDGALVIRQGYERKGSDRIASIFAYNGYVFVITESGQLQWDLELHVWSASRDASDLFHSFAPSRETYFADESPAWIGKNNLLFISSRHTQSFIDLEETSSGDLTHSEHPFYLPKLGNPNAFGTALGNREAGVFLRYQAVKATDLGSDVDPVFYPIEAVGHSTQLGPGHVNELATITLDVGTLETDTDANYIDIFQTESTPVEDITDLSATAIYYFVKRIPYFPKTKATFGLKSDVELELERTLVEPIAEPDWKFSEISEERLYLVSSREPSRIYMSHYEGSEQYYRTITDYVDVNTEGEAITGLKRLRENILSIYTPNRILLMSIDPDASQHRIIQVISTKGDRDASTGCIAPQSLVDIGGLHYFLAPNKQLYRFGGQQPTWISAPVMPLLEQMPLFYMNRAVAHAEGDTYILSYPSTPTSIENDARLVYDTQRNIWWKDDFGYASVSKGSGSLQNVFAIKNEAVVLLNSSADDDGSPIEWFWKGNRTLVDLNTLFHSLFIGLLPEMNKSLTLNITLKTEEGEQTQTISVENANAFWKQMVGFNLRGRSVQVTLSGEGSMKLDRLIFNPEV